MLTQSDEHVDSFFEAPKGGRKLPRRLVRMVVRHSGYHIRRLICWLKIKLLGEDHDWQDIEVGDDTGLHPGRICGFCRKEEVSSETETLEEAMEAADHRAEKE